MKTVRIFLSNPGTLANYFTKKDKEVIFNENGFSFSASNPMDLIIEGELNNTDIEFIRDLCIIDRRSNKNCSFVENLDLSKVTFVSDNEGSYFTTRDPYGRLCSYATMNHVITSYMFARLSIQNFILPQDITTIEHHAFDRASIKTIVFPDSLKLLQQSSIEACKIENITINAETILQKSFCGCGFLNKITLGEKVKHINAAFGYNRGLKQIEIAENNKNFKKIDNCLVNAKGTQLILFIQEEHQTAISIPEGIERVCGGAFQGEPHLTEIILPNTLKYIGSSAFYLTKISEIHIPAEVVSISDHAFPNSIERLYFYSPIPPTMHINVWYFRNTTIFIPKGCKELYQQKWKQYVGILHEADYEAHTTKPKKEIKNRAFYKELVSELKGMTSITITHPSMFFTQGRFEGCTFLSVWSKNLYYIKWMIRVGTISDIDNTVFNYLLAHYPVKAKAIRYLITLLHVSQFKRAKAQEENERIRNEYMEYMAEIAAWKAEQAEIEEANRAFEEMMNEYDAWGNID